MTTIRPTCSGTRRWRDAAHITIAMSFALVATARAGHAQTALRTVVAPPTGKIVFGSIPGQTSESGAMGWVLSAIHKQFNARPQVGKLFQVRGTQSVAAFFSVKTGDAAHRERDGLIIVTKATSDDVEAGVVSDDATRFPQTYNAMVKTLLAQWHPMDAARTAAANSGPSAPAARLTSYTLPDRSASVGLPDGWKILPRMSAGGTLIAMGPHGESTELGITFLANDPRHPAVQRTLAMLRRGMLRGTAYESATYLQYGGDPVQTYITLIQNIRRRAQLPPASYKLGTATAVQAPPPLRCARFSGTADLNDQQGPRETNVVYCVTPPSRTAGIWMSQAYTTMVPMKVAASERATLAAILNSFQVDQNVVARQAAAISAPAIEAIKEVGRVAAARAEASSRAMEIHNSSVYQHWDDMDKRSQDFSNYQLGYSVVNDVPNNAHATLWNEHADALVKHDPSRLEYVNAPNFWKGVDY